MAMEFFIACGPEDHPVVPGAGGFRKARWAQQGRGKSGSFRVIYFFLAEPGRVYRNVLGKLAAQIKRAAKGGR